MPQGREPSAVPSLSRRALLAGAPALAVIPKAVPAADPASELVAACVAFHAVRAEEKRIDTLPLYDFESPEELAVEAQTSALNDRKSDILERAAQVPARTPDGLWAKAMLVQASLPDHVRDFDVSIDDDEIVLVMSLMADILSPRLGSA